MSGSNWPKWEHYETYIGRWSRVIAVEFLDWLSVQPGRRWLDIGCGPGALTQTILDRTNPVAVTGIDSTPDYVDHVCQAVDSPVAEFSVADARELPFADAAFDAVVSGLVLNFIPEPERALAEMVRVTSPGGVVGGYVWDYQDGLPHLRVFWDAAAQVEPSARQHDHSARFPTTRPEWLRCAFSDAGLEQVEIRGIEFMMPYPDFDTFWVHHLGTAATIQRFVDALDDRQRTMLIELTTAGLPANADGSIDIPIRAWAVKGKWPG